MRTLIVALALALLPAVAGAQRDTSASRGLPRDVRRDAERLWNAPAALRDSGAVTIDSAQTIDGDVAVRNGPLTVAGHVTGRVLAINTDVNLTTSARIDGDLLVIGGTVTGRDVAYVGGEIRIYRERLGYDTEGDRIATHAGADQPDDNSWWRRWERRRSDSWSKIQIASAGAYNRVEGLPINLGPQVYRRTPWGSFRLDAYGVLRTGSSFSSSSNDVGHSVRGEFTLGRVHGLGFGGQLYDVVNGVEDWQLSDIEVGLASFLFHRDYRDYYQRHGGRLFASVFARPDVGLTLSYGDERWTTRQLHDPFTLFYDRTSWRPSPLFDEGVVHVADVALHVDTRNDLDRPWAGWYAVADYEHGTGNLTTLGASSYARAIAGPVSYGRAFVDLRRYNRISPDAQINLRVVMGGWVGGDALPLERRLSVEGAGAVPGFDFRAPGDQYSTGTCSGPNAPPGRPAECDRIALGQVEYRGSFHIGWDDDGQFDRSYGSSRRYRHRGLDADGAVVLFADAGRGWLVNTPGTPLSFGKSAVPPLSTFRSDIGAGLDFGEFGIFVAKALSVTGMPANVFVRLRHRF